MYQTLGQTTGETTTGGGITNAPVAPKRKVSFVIRTFSSSLRLPYAVEVGGVVRSEFNAAAKIVRTSVFSTSNYNPAPAPQNIIEVAEVPAGTTVRLYLNSDAHPDYRKNPVYAVTPTTKDVIVYIWEKKNHATETDTLVPHPSPDAPTLERFHGTLTGITWMKITHKYVPAEIAALIPPDTLPEVVTAVRAIFTGLNSNQYRMDVVGPPARTITIDIPNSSECANHIAPSSGYNFFADSLTRVHPASYAALLTAAIRSGVNSMRLESGWRPMRGSIGHRAGLGLDVSILGGIVLNREGITSPGPNTATIPAADRAAYNTWKASPTAANLNAWETVLTQNQPEVVKKFRAALDESPFVAQIFDPWLMDMNARDAVDSREPNKLVTSNETTHGDHLHVTIYEPKILPPGN